MKSGGCGSSTKGAVNCWRLHRLLIEEGYPSQVLSIEVDSSFDRK